ncbi:MAG TPA: hypothetical protein VLQ48_05810 [Chloroflexia bacterium]|nr:hypothetical protein [Chloroflexia bacterium]
MARSYERKKTSTKLLEGFTAGLAGGVAFILVLMIADVLAQASDIFYTVSLFGSILTGSTITAAPGAGASFLVGVLLLLIIFGLLGIGIVYYLPIIYRLGLHKAVFGAIYGVLIWLLVFFFALGVINQSVAARTNWWVLCIASIIAGAAIGWALDLVMSKKGGQLDG